MQRLFFNLFIVGTVTGGITLQAASAKVIASVFQVDHPAKANGPSDFDPSRIRYADEYGILENILSPLIEVTPSGDYAPGLAESFGWQGRELHLTIRSAVHTRDGQPVTAEDAAFSLKRLILQSRNTHGRIGDLLCPDKSLKSIDDDCAGIQIRGNKLILVPTRGRPFLVPMLTAIDFGILTRSSVDKKSLEIIDHRNTSGPYYIESFEGGAFTLRANSNHWKYRKDIPQVVRFTPSDSSMAGTFPAPFELFRKRALDFIPNSSVLGKHRFIDYAKSDKEATLHATHNVSRVLLVFTDRGMKDLSLERRASLARQIQASYWERATNSKQRRERATQWYAEQGEGNLSPLQLKELEKFYSSVPAATDGKGLKLSLFGQAKAEAEAILLDRLPSLEIASDLGQYNERQNKSPGYHPDDPHMTIITTDGMWNENIAFVSYSIAQRMYPMSDVEANSWLLRFMDTEERSQRLSMLQALHFQALREVKVVPLVSEPQFTIVRKPWIKEPTPIFASSALWRMTKP